MKRTISECIDLINEKMENAKNNKDGFKTTKDTDIEHAKAYSQLAGEMLAYADVLSLLETSHLTEQEKELKISKKALEILEPRIKLVEGTLTNDGIQKEVVWIESSGFVFKDSEEHKVLSEILKK